MAYRVGTCGKHDILLGRKVGSVKSSDIRKGLPARRHPSEGLERGKNLSFFRQTVPIRYCFTYTLGRVPMCTGYCDEDTSVWFIGVSNGSNE